jgi:hypothetical protein
VQSSYFTRDVLLLPKRISQPRITAVETPNPAANGEPSFGSFAYFNFDPMLLLS